MVNLNCVNKCRWNIKHERAWKELFYCITHNYSLISGLQMSVCSCIIKGLLLSGLLVDLLGFFMYSWSSTPLHGLTSLPESQVLTLSHRKKTIFSDTYWAAIQAPSWCAVLLVFHITFAWCSCFPRTTFQHGWIQGRFCFVILEYIAYSTRSWEEEC